jgi:hypothetical protein
VTYSHCLSPADHHHTDKKENQILLIFEEIQSGAVAKSYMRKGFLIYEEMRKYFPIYEEAVLNFNLIFFFISAPSPLLDSGERLGQNFLPSHQETFM